MIVEAQRDALKIFKIYPELRLLNILAIPGSRPFPGALNFPPAWAVQASKSSVGFIVGLRWASGSLS